MTTTVTMAMASVRRLARAYAYRWGLDADDVEGDALLRLVERGDATDPRHICVMAHSAAVDAVRRRNVRMRVTAHPPMSSPLIDPAGLSVAQAWAALSDDERICAIASGGPGCAELAAERGWRPEVVSRIARRARDALLAAA